MSVSKVLIPDEGFRLSLPDGLLEAIAERAAALALERLGEQEKSLYMTIVEAAEYLRCRRQRIDDLLSQRRLSRLKEGGRTLVLRAEVEALVVEELSRRVAPRWPRTSQAA